ncbi:unnamed protein product [Rhizopus microsporus]
MLLVMPNKKRKLNEDKLTKKKSKIKEIKLRHRTETDSSGISHNGFQQLFNGREPEDTLLYRQRAFYRAWNKINTIINDTLVDMNQTAYSQIRQFVDKAHDVKEELISLPFHEIPTALVFAGINTPDHAKQFEHIALDLKQPPSETNGRQKRNFVSLLQAKDCPTLKHMMKLMIERTLENTEDKTDNQLEKEEEEEEEDDDDIIRTVQPSTAPSYQFGRILAKESKALSYDMQLLEGWYKHRSKYEKHKPNLVVILQDFEAFEPNVLQDFLSICSKYQTQLPIVCIIGVATSTEFVHQSLTKLSINMLRIERFKLENSDVWFNKVIEKLFLESIDTLRFGPRPYKFLLDHFYLYDFSITKASASIKYAYMHHFYGNPLSIFLPLLKFDKQKMRERLKEWRSKDMLNTHHVVHIRMLSSFRAYIEKLATTKPRKALRLLEDDEELLIQEVPELLANIKQYYVEFVLGIDLVQVLQSQFSSFSYVKKSRRMILLEALEAKEGYATQSELIQKLISLLRKMDADQIESLLKELQNLYQRKEYSRVSNEALKKLNEWHERLMRLMDLDDDAAAKADKKAKKIEGMVMTNIEDKHGRHTATAQKAQNESIEFIRRLGTESTKIAIDIADWINDVLGHYLEPFTKKPLYEITYYTNVRLLEKSFASQPRATVQTALTQPSHYLNCTCCGDSKERHLAPSEPDACVLYKLYLECGRMINLYDWFVAFSSVIEKEKRDKPLEENEAQARFIKSVAELQFLGFIKPTQRKTDHVQRLTWSNI